MIAFFKLYYCLLVLIRLHHLRIRSPYFSKKSLNLKFVLFLIHRLMYFVKGSISFF